MHAVISLPGQPLSSAFHAGRFEQFDRALDDGLGGTVGLREQPVDLVAAQGSISS